MSKLRIEIEMDNAAFGEEQAGCAAIEVARILRELSRKCEHTALEDLDQKLKDINGNTVGFVETWE